MRAHLTPQDRSWTSWIASRVGLALLLSVLTGLVVRVCAEDTAAAAYVFSTVGPGDGPAVVLPDGMIYVAEPNDYVVGSLSPAGVFTNRAGSYYKSHFSDGTTWGVGFLSPACIALGADKRLYVGDSFRLRRMTTSGTVTTIAGGERGFKDGSGSAAKFGFIELITTGPDGNLYVYDSGNNAIRKVTPAGRVTTLLSLHSLDTAEAEFGWLAGLMVAPGPRVIFVDVSTKTFRVIEPDGSVRLWDRAVVGTDGRPAALQSPTAFTLDAKGSVFLLETATHQIMQITPEGALFPVADDEWADPSGWSGATPWPNALTSDGDGNLYVSDRSARTIRRGELQAPVYRGTGPLIYTAGRPVRLPLAVSGNPTKFSAGGLPAGLKLDALTGVLSGKTATLGKRTVTLTAENRAGSRTTTFVLQANQAPTIVAPGDQTVASNASTPALSCRVGDVDNPAAALTLTASSSDEWLLPAAGIQLGGTGVNRTIKLTPATGRSGTVTVTVSVSDSFSVTEAKFKVTVKPLPTVFTALAGARPGPGWLDGDVKVARFNYPTGITTDAADNIYVSDAGNQVIRKIGTDGRVTTIAGSPGKSGGVDGTGSAARFNVPTGLAVDGKGNIFVADTMNATIRRITPAGKVTTLAGAPTLGSWVDGTGSAARFAQPTGLTIMGDGTLYVADEIDMTIRKVTPAGVVTTFAGKPYSFGAKDGVGQAAEFTYPSAITHDSAGNLYVADTHNAIIRKITHAGSVSTLAGLTWEPGYKDGPGNTARFHDPMGIVADPAGNLYVADATNSVIRKITSDGTVSTIAGTGGRFGSTDGSGAAARFSAPLDVARDRAGNLYVADSGNNRIRKITPDGAVSTLTGSVGSIGSGDGNAAAAQFNSPNGIAVDVHKNLYVADTLNHTIRRISAKGTVTTVAGIAGQAGSNDGSPSTARFYQPRGVAVDATGRLYVADTRNHVIRKIDPTAGRVTTLAGVAGAAGSADGVGAAARFFEPSGVAVDAAGNVYVADTRNHAIRKITPAGRVTTLAGLSGRSGAADGRGKAARFNSPWGVAVDPAGNVYVADTSNGSLRKITPAGQVSTLVKSLQLPVGIALDANGNIYASELSRELVRYSPDGTLIFVSATDPENDPGDGTGAAGGFFHPSGVAIDSAGVVYVCDNGHNEICVGRFPVVPKLTSASTITAVLGRYFSATPEFSTPLSAVTAVGMPSGLAIDPTSGIIVGKPTQTGTFAVTLTLRTEHAMGAAKLKIVVDSPPTIGRIANQTIPKNGHTAGLAFLVSDAETAGAKLKVTRTSSNSKLIPLSGIVLGGSGATRTVKITPAKNQTGSGWITLIASDGVAETSTSFKVTVTTAAATALARTVAPEPEITLEPLNRVVKVGGSVTFAAASNLPQARWCWTKDGRPLAGATTATLTVRPVALTDAGGYAATATGNAGSATTRTAELAVVEAHASVSSFGDQTFTAQTLIVAGLADGLGVDVLLPAGWSYVEGDPALADAQPRPGDTGFLEWHWPAVPVGPLTFRYVLRQPAGSLVDLIPPTLIEVHQGDETTRLLLRTGSN